MIISEYVLTWTIVVQLVLIVLLGMLIIGYSTFRRRREERESTLRSRLRPALLEQLFSSDPDWSSFVEPMNREDRRVLKKLLDDYLRRIKGTDFDKLGTLANELGIEQNVRNDISGERRLHHALTWLALLHEPLEPDRLEEVCGDDPVLRAAGANVLLNSDHPDGPERGTELLLDDGIQPLTVMGMETLYRLNNGTGTPLLSYMEQPVGHWHESLLVQVLLILSHCSVTGSLDRLDWMVDLLDHDSGRVRLAVISVIRRHGWREGIRSRIPFDQLMNDSDFRVRENTYVLLADWGDDASLNWLHRATENQRPRDRLSITEAMHVHPDGSLANLPDAFAPFVEWVRAERSVRTSKRLWGNASAWI